MRVYGKRRGDGGREERGVSDAEHQRHVRASAELWPPPDERIAAAHRKHIEEHRRHVSGATWPLTFTLPGCPRPWRRAGRKGKGHYNPNRAEQQRIAYAAMAAVAEQQALVVKAKAAGERERARGLPNGLHTLRDTWPTDARYAITVRGFYPDRKRRDIDNVMKNVKDALSRVLYRDDCQVDEEHNYRIIDAENPRLVVTVEVLGEPGPDGWFGAPGEKNRRMLGKP